MSGLAAIQQHPKLAVREFAGNQHSGAPVVLIHGWGCDSRVWEPLASLLAERQRVLLVDLPGFGDSPAVDDPTCGGHYLSLLADALPEHCHLVGWSLGGMLATAFAAAYANRVASLVCIATNLSFQAEDDWQSGMNRTTFAGFQAGFKHNPAITLKRFRGLQAKGDCRERQVLKTLNHLAAADRPREPTAWQGALTLLGTIDNRKAAQQLSMPCLYLFGEHDQLVPKTAAAEIGRAANIQVEVLPDQAHAPHLSDPGALAHQLQGFYRQQQHRLNKQQVAESFGRSAATYDGAAHLQRAVGNRLLALAESVEPPAVILDAGCGTGHFSEILDSRFPGAQLLAVDLSEGMVKHARAHRPGSIPWSCGDAEQLPFIDHAVDLYFSNLAVQWCEQPDKLAGEIHRVLAPGGTALVSTLGPSTLQEMRTAWHAVDEYVHVNCFTPMGVLRQSFQQAGFAGIQLTTETRTVFYGDAISLSRELKALGAHNVNTGRPRGMTGRQRLKQFADAYEQFREARGLPATWEVIYCELSK